MALQENGEAEAPRLEWHGTSAFHRESQLKSRGYDSDYFAGCSSSA
jgi:hypothetical protein